MSQQSAPDLHDGTLEERDGRYVTRFERRIPHPVERVWDALTRPDVMCQWYGAAEIELDLVPGGRFVTRVGPGELADAIVAEVGEEHLESEDTVLTVEPPVRFEHTFGGNPESIARWELERDGADRCILRLAHTEPSDFPRGDAPRDLSGWHAMFDLLADVLDGTPTEWTMRRWEGLEEHYRATLA